MRGGGWLWSGGGWHNAEPTMHRYSGLLTDLYELTMAAGYVETRFEARATFELFVRNFPARRTYLVATAALGGEALPSLPALLHPSGDKTASEQSRIAGRSRKRFPLLIPS